MLKTGRFGEFTACSNYPACKYVKQKTIGVKCPECSEGEVIERRSARGKTFYGCNRYPDCNFVAWGKPVAEKCPECGSPYMVEKWLKAGPVWQCPNPSASTSSRLRSPPKRWLSKSSYDQSGGIGVAGTQGGPGMSNRSQKGIQRSYNLFKIEKRGRGRTGGFMKPFKWSKSNAVFVPEIDAEHKTIFRMAEELQQALRGGHGAWRRLQPRLKALMEHAEAHFEHEERLMRDSVCPSFEWHKRQHNTLRKRLRQFVPQIHQGDRQAMELVMEFLGGWLRDHTGLTDRIMSAHVRNHQREVARLAS